MATSEGSMRGWWRASVGMQMRGEGAGGYNNAGNIATAATYIGS